MHDEKMNGNKKKEIRGVIRKCSKVKDQKELNCRAKSQQYGSRTHLPSTRFSPLQLENKNTQMKAARVTPR